MKGATVTLYNRPPEVQNFIEVTLALMAELAATPEAKAALAGIRDGVKRVDPQTPRSPGRQPACAHLGLRLPMPRKPRSSPRFARRWRRPSRISNGRAKSAMALHPGAMPKSRFWARAGMKSGAMSGWAFRCWRHMCATQITTMRRKRSIWRCPRAISGAKPLAGSRPEPAAPFTTSPRSGTRCGPARHLCWRSGRSGVSDTVRLP